MPSLSRLAVVFVLPFLAACTVYTPAEYRYLEETRADSARVNRAAAAPVDHPSETSHERVGPPARHGVRRTSGTPTPVSLEEHSAPRTPGDRPHDPEPSQG